MERINVKTSEKVEMIDITSRINKLINKMGIDSGAVLLSVPHTTAGITINESADPAVKKDIMKELNKIIPFKDGYKHREGNSAAHIKSTLVGISETIMIERGKLQLGRWQGLFFCEFDGPRNRKLYIKDLKMA